MYIKLFSLTKSILIMGEYDIMGGDSTLWDDTKLYVGAHWLALLVILVIIIILAWYFDVLPSKEGMGNMVALQKQDEVYFGRA